MSGHVVKVCYVNVPGLVIVTKSQVILLSLGVVDEAVQIGDILHSELIDGDSVTNLLYCDGRVLLSYASGSIWEFLVSTERFFFGFRLSSLVKLASSSPIQKMQFDAVHHLLFTLHTNDTICVYSLDETGLHLMYYAENPTLPAQTSLGRISDWKIVSIDCLPSCFIAYPAIVATTRNGTRFFFTVRNERLEQTFVRASAQSRIIVNSTSIIGGTFAYLTDTNQVLMTTRCSGTTKYVEVCEMLREKFPAVEFITPLPEPQLYRRCTRNQCELRFW